MSVRDIEIKAQRMAAVGQLVATFDGAHDRIFLIRELVSKSFISQEAGEILLDEYAPEGSL